MYLFISIGNHVSDPPALVLKQIPQRCQQNAVARLLFFGNFLCNRNKNVNCKQTDAVLIIARQVLEKGNYFIDDDLALHFFDKLGQIVGRLSPHHRGFIVYQRSEMLSEALLQRWSSLLVWCGVKTSRRDLRGEPVCL